MDSNYKPYDHETSFRRIDDILNQSDINYEEVDALPDRDRLTYSNGFYAYCSALFVDPGSTGRKAPHRCGVFCLRDRPWRRPSAATSPSYSRM